MNRRHFLKICAAAIGGMVLAKFSGWFNFSRSKDTGLKEARFYKRADHLAG